ncbi:uncharacterized protein OCT59_019332 [Rhizophagus irregularis]|uniref:uncharacterized protein n=1 Tax=Rhizophagus irregularis TaxID=588596 RepID=UPI003327EF50|nr:hypothetical protein OCT59_019332 [Rhizophagus irregularis]
MLEHLFMLQKQRSEETGLRLPEISRVKNIKYITTYSVNSISELTNDKVQDIIDNFSEHYDNDNTDVSSHMTEILAGGPGQNSVEVSELIAPIPVTHGSNSLGNSSFTLQITPSEAENNVDYDDVYFNDSMPSSIEKETNKVKINDDSDCVMTMILKKRCQTIRMMMDIIVTVDIMNMVNVIEVIIIITEDTKEKAHQ